MSTIDAPQATPPAPRRFVGLAVLAAALGYFVDSFDWVLFGAVRLASLRDLGVDVRQFAEVGERLQNSQLLGLCLGGLLWGALGDTVGRRAILFSALVVHAVANVLTAQTQTVEAYAAWRFLAGIGLAGELGSGVTLAIELQREQGRGYGVAIIAALGALGGLLASQVSALFAWRTAYWIAGGLGGLLLLLRLGVMESDLFAHHVRQAERPPWRRQVWRLLRSRSRLAVYLTSIGVALPIWYCIGILGYFAREFGEAMGMAPRPQAATALLCCYLGMGLGDVASSVLSQHWRSRRRVMRAFIAAAAVAVAAYFTFARASLTVFYGVCVVMGASAGYWAVFVASVAEQFGTGVRVTATTTIANWARAGVVLMTLFFGWMNHAWGLGRLGGYAAIAGVCFVVALLCLWRLPETFGRDLDFVED